jgi:hypothetical protein
MAFPCVVTRGALLQFAVEQMQSGYSTWEADRIQFAEPSALPMPKPNEGRI